MTGRYATRANVQAVAADLSERDQLVLGSVFKLRFISGGQLTRLHFAELEDGTRPRAARRLLTRLVDLDVLMRLPRRVGGVRAGSSGFVYCLGLVGHRLTTVYGWQPEHRSRRPRTPGMAFLQHTLAIAELHVRLVEAERAGRLELLELTAEPVCWRSYGGIGNQREASLKPDSYVRVGLGDFEDSYFIEVDRGTEGSRTIERKLHEYVAYEATGLDQEERGVFPRTLWVVPDEQRATAIRDSVRRLPQTCRELFAVASQADALDVVSGTSPNRNST